MSQTATIEGFEFLPEDDRLRADIARNLDHLDALLRQRDVDHRGMRLQVLRAGPVHIVRDFHSAAARSVALVDFVPPTAVAKTLQAMAAVV